MYRKPAGGSWAMLGTTTSTSYTDDAATDLTDGATYYYTVRAYHGDEAAALANKYASQYWSYFDTTGLKTVHLSTPELNYAVCDGDNVVVSWYSVPKASGYAVYRKTNDGSWSMIGTTTAATYTDDDAATQSDQHRYTVRAYMGSETTAKQHTYSSVYWSGYDDNGIIVQ